MKIKIIRKKDGVTRKISDSYSVLNLLTEKDSDNMSLAICTAENQDKTTKTSSDRAYYVLDGELIVNDDGVARKGDVVFIPANTEYNFKGNFSAVLVNSPPFKKENESHKK